MHKKPIKCPKVPGALIDALEVVLARLWEGERLDYHYGDDLGDPDRQQHFFLKLEVIRLWLDYVEEECGRG